MPKETGRPLLCITPAYLAWRGAKVPSILTIHNLAYQGPVPEGVAAADRRAGKFLPYRWARRFYDKYLLPQGRHRLRLSSDHRQRRLMREGDRRRLELGCGLEGLLRDPFQRPATDRNSRRHRRELGSALLRCQLAQPLGAGDWRASGPTPTTSVKSARACGISAGRSSVWSPSRAPEGRRPRAVAPPTRSSMPADRSW